MQFSVMHAIFPVEAAIHGISLEEFDEFFSHYKECYFHPTLTEEKVSLPNNILLWYNLYFMWDAQIFGVNNWMWRQWHGANTPHWILTNVS